LLAPNPDLFDFKVSAFNEVVYSEASFESQGNEMEKLEQPW
jgi:hypothetical protein